MNKNNKIIKHTIYSFLWLIVWMFAVSWGSKTLTLFIDSHDVNMLILCAVIFVSAWVGTQRFLANMIKVMLYKGEKEEEKNNGKEL